MLLGNESAWYESPALWAGVGIVIGAAAGAVVAIWNTWGKNSREDQTALIANYRQLLADEREERQSQYDRVEKAQRDAEDFKRKYADTLAELMKYKSQGSPGGGGERYTG